MSKQAKGKSKKVEDDDDWEALLEGEIAANIAAKATETPLVVDQKVQIF